MSAINQLYQHAYNVGRSTDDHDAFGVALYHAVKACIPSLPHRLGYNVEASDIYLWQHHGRPYAHVLHDRIINGEIYTWSALRQFVFFKLMSESAKSTRREETRLAAMQRYAEHISRSPLHAV